MRTWLLYRKTWFYFSWLTTEWKLTLGVFLLLFSLPWVNNHPSFKTLQETWRLLPLLDLDLEGHDRRSQALCPHKVLTPWKQMHTSVRYLCSSLFIQLHRHQCRRSFLADGGVAALPEEVAALLFPRPSRLHLIWVLSLPNWWNNA